ncbi:hypothetical protein TNCV_2485591 [Trichonephila clavipes]|uniref:Uncharacterized protein n=1 Tax=Trichonephila clavipes TaxID=2585209 RepID=A0A8X6VZU4_TRICX|nr:hypothetical protein TNCV_2485591 [Trichonephila clavipes]
MKVGYGGLEVASPLRKPMVAGSTPGRGSLVVKVSDRGWLVTSSSPVPLKTRFVGERWTLNLSKAQTFARWCGVVVRRASVVLVS